LRSFGLWRGAFRRAYVDTRKERNKATGRMNATLMLSICYRGTDGSRARPRCSSLVYVQYRSLLAPCLARLPSVVRDEN